MRWWQLLACNTWLNSIVNSLIFFEVNSRRVNLSSCLYIPPCITQWYGNSLGKMIVAYLNFISELNSIRRWRKTQWIWTSFQNSIPFGDGERHSGVFLNVSLNSVTKIYVITAKGLELATQTQAPQRQQDTCRDKIFKLSPIRASVIFRFPEFAAFSKRSAIFWKNSSNRETDETSFPSYLQLRPILQ